jgi:high affinity choline transporter 7
VNKKAIYPTLALMALLVAVGLVLWLNGSKVFWGGFIAMMGFYGVTFFVGAYAATKGEQDSINDVMLAGRSLPLFVAVFTMSATWIDGGYINGTAEYTATSGLMWVQAPWGYALSLIIGGLFFARTMRRHKFRTMLDPLEQRFGKRMAALLFLPALSGEVFWTSAILTALGTTFGTVLNLDFTSAIILSSFIAIAYTVLGGLWAIAVTDVIQLIFLFIGLIVVVPFALDAVGGLANAWDLYKIEKGAFASPFPNREALGDYWYVWWDNALLLTFGGIAWQVYFQRVLSAKNEKVAVRLSILAGVMCILAAIPAVIIGIVGDVQSTEGWLSAGAPGSPESASLTLAYVIRYLTPPAVAILGLGAIAAAVMSSVDSSIMSASSMAAWNVWRPLFNPSIKSAELTKVIRRSIWIIGIAATLMALKVKSIYALWFLCSDFVFCMLFPQLVCALFDKKANVAGSVVGFIVSFILRFGGGDATLGIPRLLPYPMILEDGTVGFPFRTVAMLAGLISIIVVSRLTQQKYPAKALQICED